MWNQMNVWKFNIPQKVLGLYPTIVSKFITPKIWGLGQAKLNAMYEKYTGTSHLEIGPGPDPYRHCILTKLSIMDLNESVLDTIRKTYPHPEFETYTGDILNQAHYHNQLNASLASFNLMHCISEPAKWLKFFHNVDSVLEPGGVLFGASVHNLNPLSKCLNTLGIFHNRHDTVDIIKIALKQSYSVVELQNYRNCLVWVLRKNNNK